MIYGIGLPRTGTTTLAEALRILGYFGHSQCELTGKLEIDEEYVTSSNLRKFEVVNSAYQKFKPDGYFTTHSRDRYILTTRHDIEWGRSLYKHGANIFDIPSPSVYGELVERVIPKHQLLVVDWSECKDYQCNWKKLCDFLVETIPSEKFPCKNCDK